MSMNPGVTAHPDASSTRSPSKCAPISMITPSLFATSATRPGAPVPSKTVPPLIAISVIDHELQQVSVGIARVHARRGRAAAPLTRDRPLFDLRPHFVQE